MKINFNQNLLDIFNYIESKNEYVSYSELLHFCLDYENYRELYLHHNQIIRLLDEHNNDILSKTTDESSANGSLFNEVIPTLININKT